MGDTQTFQIEAVSDDPGRATTTQLREMLKAMLANRFRLAVARETREVSGYALLIADHGPKIRPAVGNDESVTASNPSTGIPNGVVRLVTRFQTPLDKLAGYIS